MKKLIAILLALCMVFTFTACEEDDDDDRGPKKTSSTTSKEKKPSTSVISALNKYVWHIDVLLQGGYWEENTNNPQYISGSKLYEQVYTHLLGASMVDPWIDSDYVKNNYPPDAFSITREEWLAKFTVLEDVPLQRKIWYEDALGNIHDGDWHTFLYEPDGTMIENYGDLNVRAYQARLPDRTDTKRECVFDANGNLTEIRYVGAMENNQSYLFAVRTYTYNPDGTVATERYVQDSGEEYHAAYTYENGKVVKATGHLWTYSSSTSEVIYLYDDQGRLIEEKLVDGDYVRTIIRFYYEGNAEKPYAAVKAEPDYWYAGTAHRSVVYWKYIYREDGEISGATIRTWDYIGLDEDPETLNYSTYNMEYHYGNYYIFTNDTNEES